MIRYSKNICARLAVLALAGVLIPGPVHATDLRIVDGDTIAIGATKIRIWGIDAPEMNTAAGRRAKSALTAIIGHHAVTCTKRDHDRYGRIVAQCYANSTDLACEMVRQGHARDWPRYSRGYYRRCEE